MASDYPSISDFGVGVFWLQQQAELPYTESCYAWLVPCVLAAATIAWALRHARSTIRFSALLATVPLAFVVGFYWAAWNATQRMADELPPA